MAHAEPVDVLTVKAPFHETRGLGLADLLRLCRRPGHRLQKTLREIVVVAVIVLKTISAQRTELMRRRIDLPVEEQPTRLHERVLRIDLRIVQSLPPAHPRADRGVHLVASVIRRFVRMPRSSAVITFRTSRPIRNAAFR